MKCMCAYIKTGANLKTMDFPILEECLCVLLLGLGRSLNMKDYLDLKVYLNDAFRTGPSLHKVNRIP